MAKRILTHARPMRTGRFNITKKTETRKIKFLRCIEGRKHIGDMSKLLNTWNLHAMLSWPLIKGVCPLSLSKCMWSRVFLPPTRHIGSNKRKERERETDRQTDRERETDRVRERETERERERERESRTKTRELMSVQDIKNVTVVKRMLLYVYFCLVIFCVPDILDINL